MPTPTTLAWLGLVVVVLAQVRLAELDITGSYRAKDAEFVVQKVGRDEYRVSYFGHCSLRGDPFEFYTNGKARRVSNTAFAIAIPAAKIPSCASFAPFAGQEHIIEMSSSDPSAWHFRANEPDWISKQRFVHGK